jgi:hypothetical protein
VRFRSLVAFGLALVPATFVSLAQAEEALPPVVNTPPPADLPPPGARVTHIVAGLATTAVAYGVGLGTSYLWDEQDWRGSKNLRIPIAGPWMALGKTGCVESGCNKFPVVAGALFVILDGVVQAGGLGIIGEGLFLKTSGNKPAPQNAQATTLRAVPFNFEKNGVGLGVVGTF